MEFIFLIYENSVFLAVRWGNTDILELLLNHNANPNIYNKSATSPLHLCVEFHAADAARLLLMKGADPNYQNNDGQTPFHVAVVNGDVQLSQIFYESGADPEIRDASLKIVWDCCSEDFMKEVTMAPPDEGPPPPPPEPLPRENSRQWLLDGKCFVCREMDADRYLLPCRHKCVCHSCSEQFFEQYSTCPDCYMAVFAAVKD
ncbi:hypothetical protein TRFO_23312 [Tritrichomonas foetus]|uniref:RING-type domain-containing protein n=1 Tax=Tritrichomonas foetus TaxID=1144522 RepID=A0A1J4KAJ3_9EUKA|nr:hypothetical protein TRFO_23312 [Tritrichomonas foetus]|eukprot:OHT08235.1 hypothetical protein TRFO_23312 [Tritrichomonas foetus]